jgi:hypothetical protein
MSTIPIPLPTLPNYPPTSTRGDIRNEDSENDMWNMYLDEVKEDDQRITNAWKEDANALLVFVSLNLLVSPLHLDDKLKDRSFLCNCRRIHH